MTLSLAAVGCTFTTSVLTTISRYSLAMRRWFKYPFHCAMEVILAEGVFS
jgi:hypothetical protein